MTQILTENLCFAEGPRWRDGYLWFSDMHGYKVYNLDDAGNLSTLAEIPEQPLFIENTMVVSNENYQKMKKEGRIDDDGNLISEILPAS